MTGKEQKLKQEADKNAEQQKDLSNAEDKKQGKSKIESQHPKKQEAIVNARNLQVSRKHCQYICSFIKNKSIDNAIKDLEQVVKLKKIVPFKGEIPHRKGKGIMSGRYPVKAAKLFIYLLKGLKGNVIVNRIELEKTKITSASASWASRPMRRGGMQGKRTHVILTAKEVSK